MWQLTFWTYFLVIALSLAPVQRVAACSCYPSHPQTLYCHSHFVAVVRVKELVPGNEHDLAYNVKVNKIFKSNAKADAALRQNVLWTSSSGSMCGVYLKVGETYVVSGKVFDGKARVSICGLSLRWSEVTSRQRKGFRRLYQHGCSCEINYTPWWNKGAVLDRTGGTRCIWESTPGPQDCQGEYGICMVRGGGCSWVPAVSYKNCIKEHQRKREQQRMREP